MADVMVVDTSAYPQDLGKIRFVLMRWQGAEKRITIS